MQYYKSKDCLELNGIGDDKNIFIDPNPFNPSGMCSKGGLYFMFQNESNKKYGRGAHELRSVRVVEDEYNYVYIEYFCKYRIPDEIPKMHDCNLECVKFKTHIIQILSKID